MQRTQPAPHDPQFDQAVQQALDERASAEGRPPESHSYEIAYGVQPNDYMFGVADDAGLDRNRFVSDNRQHADPNRIRPDDILFLAGESPVSDDTERLIDQALAYDRSATPDTGTSDENWLAVQNAIAEELITQDAQGNLLLKDDAQATVDAIAAWAVGTDRLATAGQDSLAQLISPPTSPQTQPPAPDIDEVIEAVETDLDTLQEKLDDHGLVRKGWGWMKETFGSERSEFEAFLEEKIDELEALEEDVDDGDLTAIEYANALDETMGDYQDDFEHYSQEELEADQHWDTLGEVARFATATAVGIGATILSGGNVAVGAAAGFGTYELIDATGDIAAELQGEDPGADGHTSLIGLGIDAAQGEASWEQTRSTLSESGGELLSSTINAVGAGVGIKTSAFVATRLAGGTATAGTTVATATATQTTTSVTRAVLTRSAATAAGGTAGQTVHSSGQLATEAGSLWMDDKLFTDEGQTQLANSFKYQTIALATAPLSGGVAGALPFNRYGIATQALITDPATSIGGAELHSQWAYGRDANDTERTAALIGSVPGTALNIAAHPGMAARMPDPDLRAGVQIRLRGNPDVLTEAGSPQLRPDDPNGGGQGDGGGLSLGRPTLASAGVVWSTRSRLLAGTWEALRGPRTQPAEATTDSGTPAADTLPGATGDTAQGTVPTQADTASPTQPGDTATAPQPGDTATAPQPGDTATASQTGDNATTTTAARSGSEPPPPTRLQRLGDMLGTTLGVSVRPHEYNNSVTLKEGGISPVSSQSALQYKASALLKAGEQVLFGNAEGATLQVVPREAHVLGAARDGSGTVVEMSYSPRIPDAESVTLAPGERDFFGAPPREGREFVRLTQDLDAPSKTMHETKWTIRPRAIIGTIPLIRSFVPRLGFERRPEAPFPGAIPKGAVVSKAFYDQNQAVLSQLARLNVRFVVKDADQAQALAAHPNVDTIRALVASGGIDPGSAQSYARNADSGGRLSDIAGNPTHTTLFNPVTGRRERWWDPKQINYDAIFNNPRLGPLANPDYVIAERRYRPHGPEAQAVPRDGRLSRWVRVIGHQPRHAPVGANSMYEAINGPSGIFGTPATRDTVSLAAPALPLGPLALSGEGRVQRKFGGGDVSPAVAASRPVGLEFEANGLPLALNDVPGWIGTFISWSKDHPCVIFPKGGKASMEDFLTQLEPGATPTQRAAIEAFRNHTLPQIKEQSFVRPETIETMLSFLESQARPAGHLPPPGLEHFAPTEVQGPLRRWYDDQGLTRPQGEAPMPLWDATRGRPAE